MGIKRKLGLIRKVFIDKRFRFKFLNSYGVYKLMPDKMFLKMAYRIEMGKKLDFNNVKLYTEKLQWLKINDHNPIYTRMVDKYEAKKYVSEIIGEQYVNPCLGVWEKFDEIDFSSLPQKFVLKCSHDSGTVIVFDKEKNIDIKKLKRIFDRRIRKNYYINNREWPYKNVLPRIIAEPYLEDTIDKELRDYKFFTFNGEPKVLYIAQGRGKDEETVADFFDMEFNHLPFTIDHDMSSQIPHPPINFELMKQLAAKLSKGTPQLRVDFYEVNGKIYFGELTFFHCSGLVDFHPEKWNEVFGDWVILPEKTI